MELAGTQAFCTWAVLLLWIPGIGRAVAAVEHTILVKKLTGDCLFSCGDNVWDYPNNDQITVTEAKGGGFCVTLLHDHLASCNGSVTGECTYANGTIDSNVVLSEKEAQERCPPSSHSLSRAPPGRSWIRGLIVGGTCSVFVLAVIIIKWKTSTCRSNCSVNDIPVTPKIFGADKPHEQNCQIP